METNARSFLRDFITGASLSREEWKRIAIRAIQELNHLDDLKPCWTGKKSRCGETEHHGGPGLWSLNKYARRNHGQGDFYGYRMVDGEKINLCPHLDI